MTTHEKWQNRRGIRVSERYSQGYTFGVTGFGVISGERYNEVKYFSLGTCVEEGFHINSISSSKEMVI